MDGPRVDTIGQVRCQSLEQSIGQHTLSTTVVTGLFGWLKNQMYCAVKTARARQMACGAQQHRGMTIVTTSMHDAFVAAAMLERVLFKYGQCVHVGTDTHAAWALSLSQGTDYTFTTHLARDFVSPLFEA